MKASIHKTASALVGCRILIKWEDSAARPGWNSVDEAGSARIISAGIMVRCTINCITLALGVSSSGRCHDQITIPIGCIKSIEQAQRRRSEDVASTTDDL